MIAALECDLVAVQEVDRGQVRSGRVDQIAELALRLGWHGLFAPTILGRPRGTRSAVDGGGDDSGGGACRAGADCPAYGIGLLSRHPVRQSARIALPSGVEAGRGPVADREPRVLLRAAVTTAIGDVQVSATHLSWAPWQAWRQLRWVLDQACDERGPSVVAGDFNLPACVLGPALAQAGWQAANAGATFPADNPRMQLDHILVRNAQLRGVRVGRVGPSDHRVLSAILIGPR